MTDAPVRRGTEIVLDITDAAFEGKSIARLEGLVVFVEGGVPGDRVRALVTKVKKQHAEARLISVDRPSSLRTPPACEHFGVCGGCRWQHVGYDAQLRFKQQHVIDALERIGGLAGFEVLPILGCDDPYWYRNKMEYSFSAREWRVEGPGPEGETDGIFLGLHVPQRYDKVLDVQRCHLQSETSNEVLRVTREFARRSGLAVFDTEREQGMWRFLVIRESRHTSDRMVNLVTREHRPDLMRDYVAHLRERVAGVTTIVNTVNRTKSQIAFGQDVHVLDGPGTIREKLGRFDFMISPQSFFQTNTLQAERLYQTVADFAELVEDDVVYDLYSGTGTIAIFLSDAARRVIGVESVASAVEDAGVNAERNGRTNCRFVLGDLKDRLTRQTEWMEEERRPRVVVTDPPRSGMHPDVVAALVRLAAERIVYVSCNPTTQARDAMMLVEGGYRLVKVRSVDMFPHTFHIENVALFERTV
ncbi:MAG: 23S rRNA (uracil(1939)-C(5))-methyltransferase RlmD [Bacteroidetes bacterium]|jgi:23S rRNA (uracil1939-C5)-methyltransferase|nr:23S rRNA (uracil(1939)-C(5))-methyltransferase RlmD [Bacteroidota bacterium]